MLCLMKRKVSWKIVVLPKDVKLTPCHLTAALTYCNCILGLVRLHYDKSVFYDRGQLQFRYNEMSCS